MDAEGYRSTPAVVQDNCGVTDGYDSGSQHKPTKRVCGSVSYENGREQARRNVTNTFREEIRPANAARCLLVRRIPRPPMRVPRESGRR